MTRDYIEKVLYSLQKLDQSKLEISLGARDLVNVLAVKDVCQCADHRFGHECLVNLAYDVGLLIERLVKLQDGWMHILG